ncbi:MAG: tRNA pseudouridine(55) synthase TruB [bacterium]|nr:tRNA pseudouridine(55) synthase TruB [bacterium]
MHGLLLINKPIHWTSFDVVKYIRKILGLRRVGHTGTLDPSASGLLILCLGKSTKLVPYLMDMEKEYEAIIKLGETRTTDDVSGKLICKSYISNISEIRIRKMLQEFVGEILQVPPMYSALKLDGKPLYKMAREGKTVKRPPRKVRINQIELLSYSYPLLKVRVMCGKGTYIRALARDLGDKLGCGACIESLTRTRIGEFNLSQAVSPKSIHNRSELESLLISYEG